MKITTDTNVLVLAVVWQRCHTVQACQVRITEAELIALPTPALCDFVWGLSQGYGVSRQDIAETIRTLINAANIVVNRPSADAGFTLLTAGGDFAGGVIAFEGQCMGSNTFRTFERQAVKRRRPSGFREVLEAA